MLKHRVQSGVVMGVALLAAVFWAPPLGVLGILLVVCGLATWEFYGLLDAARIPNFRILGLLGGLALVAATWFSLYLSNGQQNGGEQIVLWLLATAVFVRQFPQKHNERPLQTMAATVFGVLYVPYLFNYFTKMLMSWGGGGDGRFLLLYLIVVVKFTDIGAYFIGCSIGRHKMFPRISPAKSWEGSVGGVLTALAASLVFYAVTGGDLGVVQIRLMDAVVLAFILGPSAVVGDLAESLLKRAAGVKDSGTVVHGMGGTLDLIDSLLFAAPALYVYVHWFLTPA